MAINKLPRLGIYIPGNGTGGPWRYVHSILAGLDLDEFAVTVFSDLSDYQRRPEVRMVRLSETLASGVDVMHQKLKTREPKGRKSKLRCFIPSSFKLWAGFGRQVRSLARLFRTYQLDLLHTNNTGCEESPVGARCAGIPRVVGTFHVNASIDIHKLRSGSTYRLLEVISNHCLSKAIAVSEANKTDWMRRTRLPGARVVTIHNGIDPEQFRRRSDRQSARSALELPTNALIVGGMGRLDEIKGFSYLIDAIARLLPDYPNLFLAISGDGPLLTTLAQQANDRGIAGRVRFLGFQRDVQMVLDALDVFAFPSLSESLGYALLEAMATELPCVGTAVGGIPEVIVPGETGFIVRPRDPEALATVLRPLLSNQVLRDSMGGAGRRRVVNQFHECEMVRRTIGVYRSLLKGVDNNVTEAPRKPALVDN